MWPFSKSEPAGNDLNREKDGRTKSGFKKKVEDSAVGQTVIHKGKTPRGRMLQEIEEMEKK